VAVLQLFARVEPLALAFVEQTLLSAGYRAFGMD